MLDRDVEVVYDLRVIADRPDQLLRDLLRIAVQDTDPLETLDLRKPVQQLRKALLSIEIDTVEGRLLGHQDQLLRALGGESLRLLQEVLHRYRAVVSAQLRDDAVGTALVAALGDLEIRGVVLCILDALHLHVQTLDILLHADDLINLRKLLPNLLTVTLCEAARHDELLELSCFFIFTILDDGVDALLLRIPDEGAGIDDCNICLSRIIGELTARILLEQVGKHLLTVHPVLITAEGYHVNLHILCFAVGVVVILGGSCMRIVHQLDILAVLVLAVLVEGEGEARVLSCSDLRIVIDLGTTLDGYEITSELLDSDRKRLSALCVRKYRICAVDDLTRTLRAGDHGRVTALYELICVILNGVRILRCINQVIICLL